MSDTQSQNKAPRTAEPCLGDEAAALAIVPFAASRSRRVAADLLQTVGWVEQRETRRRRFITENQGLIPAQSVLQNLRARDLLLIPCRCNGADGDDPTAR